MPLDVLAFEPFDGGSHRAVRESIDRHSRHRWRWLTRPPRGWKWRMRLAACELVEAARNAGALEEPFDVIFCTSLMGAADLRALLPAGLRERPLVLYMHENQAAYPLSDHPKVDAERDVHFAITNLTSQLAADLVLWNSRWNMASFMEAMGQILKRANAVELSGWRERIEERGRVVWPPVEPPPDDLLAGARALHNDGRAVAWPHRWEHDKGPDELLELADRYSKPLELRWTILGEQYPDEPPALAEFRRRHADRIDHMGFEPDRRRYLERLASCDWVLSTALHEFFGIAVVEALLCGCLPWLPDRLSYPELLPEEARGLSPARPPEDPRAVREAVIRHLEPARAPNSVALLDDLLETTAVAQNILS